MHQSQHFGSPIRVILMLGVASLLCGAGAGCGTQAASDAVKTHALAFGAILDSQNGDPHSRLMPSMDAAEFQKNEGSEKEMLATWWGLHSRQELLDMLDGLQNGGYGQRGHYWEIRRKLLEAKVENYVHVINTGGEGASAFIVATHLGPLHGATLPITAWDFGRFINLCRWGVECEWITEQEAWDRIIPAARLLQASYASWDDYAADYLLGRNFWNPQYGTKNESIRYMITLLKLPPKGLWSTIDWNESLGTGPVLRDNLAAKLLDRYKDPDPNSVSFEHVPDQNAVLLVLRTSVDPK